MMIFIFFIFLIILLLVIEDNDYRADKARELYDREYESYFRYRKWDDKLDD